MQQDQQLNLDDTLPERKGQNVYYVGRWTNSQCIFPANRPYPAFRRNALEYPRADQYTPSPDDVGHLSTTRPWTVRELKALSGLKPQFRMTHDRNRAAEQLANIVVPSVAALVQSRSHPAD